MSEVLSTTIKRNALFIQNLHGKSMARPLAY